MKRWLLLSTAVVFAAGVVVGWVASRSTKTTSTWRGPGFFGPDDPITSMITSDEVRKELGLSDQQKQDINLLLASREKRIGDVQSSMWTISTEVHSGLHAVLTPDQEKKFERIQEERDRKENEVRVSQELVSLKKELGLSDTEEKQIHSLILAYSLDKRAIFQKGRKEGCDIRAELDALRTKRDAQIKELLPSEKFASYQELKNRQRRYSGGSPWRGGEKGDRGDKPDGKGGPHREGGPRATPTP